MQIRNAAPEGPLIYLERWSRVLAIIHRRLNRPRLNHERHPLGRKRVLALLDYATDLANAVSAECLELTRRIWAAQESPASHRPLNRLPLPEPDFFAAMRRLVTGYAGPRLAAQECLFVYVAGIALECESLSGADCESRDIIEQHCRAFADCIRAYTSLQGAATDFTHEPGIAEHAFTKWEKADNLTFLRLCDRVFPEAR